MTQQAIKELLTLGQPLFDEIKYLSTEGRYDDAYALLESTPQPDEWIWSEKSSLTDDYYYFNKIGLIEGIMNKLFIPWEVQITDQIISQSKDRFAVTVVTSLLYALPGEAEDVGGVVHTSSGIATVSASLIEGLTLASPRAFTESKKHAIRQIGSFLGRDLNRDSDDYSPQIKASQVALASNKDEAEITALYKELMGQLDQVATREEAYELLGKSMFKMDVKANQLVKSKPLKTKT